MIVCMFAKPPRPGEAKTRLAARFGASTAARLAAAFMQDTWASFGDDAAITAILATTTTDVEVFPAVIRDSAQEIWGQGDGDLGQRMQRALERGLEGGESSAAIVGADSPGLPASRWAQVRQALATAEVVLGPAADGGFYLIAARRVVPGMLHGLRWSQPDTLEQTRARLVSCGLQVATIEPWFDVDEPQDVVELQERIARGEIVAPATATLLQELAVLAP